MEREKLIEAARLIKTNCENPKFKNCGCEKVDCPFQMPTRLTDNFVCNLSFDVPDWDLPEVQDDEIAD